MFGSRSFFVCILLGVTFVSKKEKIVTLAPTWNLMATNWKTNIYTLRSQLLLLTIYSGRPFSLDSRLINHLAFQSFSFLDKPCLSVQFSSVQIAQFDSVPPLIDCYLDNKQCTVMWTWTLFISNKYSSRLPKSRCWFW